VAWIVRSNVGKRSHQQSCSQNPLSLDLNTSLLRMRGQTVTIKLISQEQDLKKLMNGEIVKVINAYEKGGQRPRCVWLLSSF